MLNRKRPMWHASEPRSARKQRSVRSGRLLLITGTPGTGKRSVGNHLALSEGFVHLDFDSSRVMGGFLGAGIDGLLAGLAANTRPGQDVVVTWSSISTAELPYVRVMQSRGFEWVWFDSDRGAACSTYLRLREDNAFRPRFVDTFEADGSFRPLDAVGSELLARDPLAAPVPVAERVSVLDRVAARRNRVNPRPARTPLRVALGSYSGPHRAIAGVGVGFATMALASTGAYFALQGGNGQIPIPVKPLVNTVPLSAHPLGSLPRSGVLVSSTSFAGVHIGDTPAAVIKAWGKSYTVCKACTAKTWFYEYTDKQSNLPVGADVVFRNGHTVAAFTVGTPSGWRATNGLRTSQLLDQQLNDAPGTWKGTTKALPVVDGARLSIMTWGAAQVAGFALTAPSQPVPVSAS